MKSRKLGECVPALIAIVFMVFLDQLSKYWAKTSLIEEPIVLWDSVFELHYATNKGAAFGIFQNMVPILSVFTILVLAGILWLYLRTPRDTHFLPLRVVLVGLFAGGLGNLIDRVFIGYVVDFFYFKLIEFPIFNVADIYATVSVAVLFALGLFYYGDEDLDCILPPKKTVAPTDAKKEQESSS